MKDEVLFEMLNEQDNDPALFDDEELIDPITQAGEDEARLQEVRTLLSQLFADRPSDADLDDESSGYRPLLDAYVKLQVLISLAAETHTAFMLASTGSARTKIL